MNCSRTVILALALGAAAPASAQQTTIKFATLAPEGSTWMNVMSELNRELQEKTGGKLKFKMYPGGVSGDEKDVVRKMRVGQLHGAGVTGVGLGEIAPSVRVLDAPFLVRDSAEADHLLARFDPELSGAIEKGGFVNLGWAEVGFVHLFTNAPVRSADDLRKVKMWVWEGDPIAEAAFHALDVHPVPLSITDVMTSLHTGLIDGVYGAPMAVIALQWFTKTKYIYSVPLADAWGAVLVSKKLVGRLPAEQRAALLELGRKHMARLTKLSREENRQALATLQKQGLTIVRPASAQAVAEQEEAGRRARRSLVGRLYSAELLDRVEGALAELRRGKAAKPSGGKAHGKSSKG